MYRQTTNKAAYTTNIISIDKNVLQRLILLIPSNVGNINTLANQDVVYNLNTELQALGTGGLPVFIM